MCFFAIKFLKSEHDPLHVIEALVGYCISYNKSLYITTSSALLVIWGCIQTRITDCDTRPEASVPFPQNLITLHKANLALLFSVTILNDRLH